MQMGRGRRHRTACGRARDGRRQVDACLGGEGNHVLFFRRARDRRGIRRGTESGERRPCRQQEGAEGGEGHIGRQGGCRTISWVGSRRRRTQACAKQAPGCRGLARRRIVDVLPQDERRFIFRPHAVQRHGRHILWRLKWELPGQDCAHVADSHRREGPHLGHGRDERNGRVGNGACPSQRFARSRCDCRLRGVGSARLFWGQQDSEEPCLRFCELPQ